MRTLKCLILLLVAFTQTGLAQEKIPVSLSKEGLDPSRIIEMPVNGLLAYEAQNGSVIFMSKNGRYVFQGKMTDVWSAKNLISSEQILESAHSLPFETMGVDFDDYGALTLGYGPKVVHVITDPLCPACTKLNRAMQELKDQYTFKILVLPALGGQSVDLSARIACEPNRKKALQAFLDKESDQLPLPNNCNFDAFKTASVVSDLIGVDAVPFIIAPDSSVNRGMPEDFEAWLSENSGNVAVANHSMSLAQMLEGAKAPTDLSERQALRAANSTQESPQSELSVNQKLLNALK